jgi:hypothetical protein
MPMTPDTAPAVLRADLSAAGFRERLPDLAALWTAAVAQVEASASYRAALRHRPARAMVEHTVI